jgi:response regulator RpfG family c-di-GMP phosphodiesterase
METKQTLLLVDDEENILKSLARTLRRDKYKIFTANGGEAGLDILAKHKVGVIVSDQRMPGMTGSEFLSRAREQYPDSIRIMLSGYTELNSVTDAINHGNIYKFLSKPWEDDFLRSNIKDAFRYYELLQENIRLSNEYIQLNKNLEQRVEERTHEVVLAMHRLQLEQNILEVLPCSVIGIDSEGMVVNANNYSHQLFDLDHSGLIGKNALNILPPALYSILNNASESEVKTEIKFGDKLLLASIKNLSDLSNGSGVVIACMVIGTDL